MLAAFLCMALNCLSNQWVAKQTRPGPDPDSKPVLSESALLVGRIVSSISVIVVVGGIVCGALALAAGRRRQERDTAFIGGMGVMLNMGIILLSAWFLWTLTAAGR